MAPNYTTNYKRLCKVRPFLQLRWQKLTVHLQLRRIKKPHIPPAQHFSLPLICQPVLKTPTLTLRTYFTEIHPWSTPADTCWFVNGPCDRRSLFGASVWSAFCHCIRKHSPVVDVVDDTAIEAKLTQADPQMESRESHQFTWSVAKPHTKVSKKNSLTSRRSYPSHLVFKTSC